MNVVKTFEIHTVLNSKTFLCNPDYELPVKCLSTIGYITGINLLIKFLN